jgi:hypothetical protein
LDRCFCTAVLELKISKEEFLDLTPYDFTLLVHHYSKVKKDDFQILRNTIFNAHANLNRKKGEKEIPLFNEETHNEIEDKEKARSEREALFSEDN